MIYLNIGPVYINIFINFSIPAHSTVRLHLHIYIYMSNLILFIYPFLEMGAYFGASTHCERKTFVYVNVNAIYSYSLTHSRFCDVSKRNFSKSTYEYSFYRILWREYGPPSYDGKIISLRIAIRRRLTPVNAHPSITGIGVQIKANIIGM